MPDKIDTLVKQTVRTIEAEIQAIDRRRDQLTSMLRALSGRENGRTATPRHPKARQRTQKRVRRSPEELKKEANEVYQLVKSQGGISSAELRRYHPKLGPDPKGFVKKFGGKTIKTKGRGRATMYVAE
jgi:hypothetical protein